jgi:hypothetical protein
MMPWLGIRISSGVTQQGKHGRVETKSGSIAKENAHQSASQDTPDLQ